MAISNQKPPKNAFLKALNAHIKNNYLKNSMLRNVERPTNDTVTWRKKYD